MEKRFIGIRHRIKKTASGEARPTQMWLNGIRLELEDDNAELDWVRGAFPVTYRDIEHNEDISGFNPRHVKWRTLRKYEDTSSINPKHLRTIEGKQQIATKVPSSYDGLKTGDVYAMSLGGSGDRLAFALSKQGEKLEATVLRLPPSILKDRRGDGDKDHDAKLLANLAKSNPTQFHEVTANARSIILVRERQAVRIDAMKARIACEQRLRQTLNGDVFCREEDFAELDIEAQFEKLKANDRILTALVAEEDQRIKELDRAIKMTQVWLRIFADVKGIGPALAGRLISSISGIERFLVEPDQARMDALYEESVRLERQAGLQSLKRFVEPGATEFDTLRRVASWCARNNRPEQAAMLERAVACHQERSRLRHKARKSTQAKLKKFCGVAVLADGTFPRRRAGSVANWHPDARQALYLLADQFNRQGDRTYWGKLLLEHKQKLRTAHPEAHKSKALVELYRSLEKRFGLDLLKPIHFINLSIDRVSEYFQTGLNLLPRPKNNIEETARDEWIKDIQKKLDDIRKSDGNESTISIYTDGHIHKMALWRTVTKFVEWLADQWSDLARRQKLQAARNRVAS